jgi:glycine oxidase
LIIGGGVIGCSAAYFLSRAGAAVTLLERGELAGEASGAAAGMLAALSDEGGDRGPDFQRLALDSLQLHQDLLPDLESTGIDLRYRRSGVLHVALTIEEAERLRHRYVAQSLIRPGMRWLDGGALAAEEPELSPDAVAALL